MNDALRTGRKAAAGSDGGIVLFGTVSKATSQSVTPSSIATAARPDLHPRV